MTSKSDPANCSLISKPFEDFKARSYQVKLLNKAIERNIIVYLRTGTGKTYIAVMLIKHFSSQIQQEFAEGGKRTIFLANNVPLVIQQAEFLRNHTSLNVGEYFGDKLIDNRILDTWSKEIWDKEFEKNQILVMSPKILVDIINHSFLGLDRINLIIFDECHHATGSHPYSEILLSIGTSQLTDIRIVGLTASVVNRKCDLNKFYNEMKKLEDKFKCKIETARIVDENLEDTTKQAKKNVWEKPTIRIIQYDSSDVKSFQLYKTLQEIKEMVGDIDKIWSERSQEMKNKEMNDFIKGSSNLTTYKADDNEQLRAPLSIDVENPFRMIKKELSELENIYEELGMLSLCIAFQKSIKCIKKLLDDLKETCDESIESINYVMLIFERIFQESIRKHISNEDEQDATKVFGFSSQKVRCLLELFRSNRQNPNDFHSIVFVERKSTAYYLNKLFALIGSLDEWSYIKSDYLYGSSKTLYSENQMNYCKQKKVVESFRKNQINILIATNIVEEGVDIPACNMIFRFSKISNFGSFVQSKGRARSANSCFYIFQDKSTADEYNKELTNFIRIEEAMETKINDEKSDNEEEDDDDSSNLREEATSKDDIESLNQLIKPYEKGTSKITCHTSISLVNRYCSTLEQNICGVLYPVYAIEEFDVDSKMGERSKKLFRCSIRLPPNSVLNQPITSDFFLRKKWSKMDAALKMCIELDKNGELADNLTILSKDEWLKPHYNENSDEEDNGSGDDTKKTKKLIGTVKNKQEYDKKVADEFKDSFPKSNTNAYLYLIDITEKRFDSTQHYAAKINEATVRKVGFVASRKFEHVPKFNLYNSNNQFTVSMEPLLDSEPIFLDESEYDMLEKLHLSIFKDVLSFDNLFEPIHGGLVVYLNQDNKIDWDFYKQSILSKISLYEYLKNPFLNEKQLTQRIMKVKMSKNRLFTLKEIDYNSKPTSDFPASNETKAKTFAEYFKNKYQEDTEDMDQPLAELDTIKSTKTFLTKTLRFKKNIEDVKRAKKQKQLFMCEHVYILPCESDELIILQMIPSILYRANCLLKAKKLTMLIEKQICSHLNLTKTEEEHSWEKSIRFHRRNQIKDENRKDSIELSDLNLSSANITPSVSIDTSSNSEADDEMNTDKQDDEDSECNSSLVPTNCFAVARRDSLNPVQDESKEILVPDLIIEENASVKIFPSPYHILQCLTLKSANDDFDMERYEILGDCFLKLIVVMKIYIDFFETNEGKMACLKSIRVSNKYLFRLGCQKNLYDYIVSQPFAVKQTSTEVLFGLKTKHEKLNLSDKSIADCIEALIGVYLINLGTNAAKSFIKWLGFTISNKKGPDDFSPNFILPDPLFCKMEPSFYKSLESKYQNFEKSIGYSFKNKVYLYQAFTHPSDIRNKYTSSYQKLELVGDAVIDILITQYIFSDKKDHSPGELTDLRQACVNNKFFGHLAVKHNFHKLLSYESPELFKKLNEYLEIHKNYSPDNAYFNLNETTSSLDNTNETNESDDDDELIDLEPPKFLADIFESVAGAIYLDSNCSLECVWKAYYRIFEPYLEAFKVNTPQSPIKALNHMRPTSKIPIEYTQNEETGEIKAKLSVDDNVFECKGKSFKHAKLNAYKAAVKKFDEDKKIIFF